MIPRWNPEADINGDNKINMKDLALICKNFGETDSHRNPLRKQADLKVLMSVIIVKV